MTRPKSLCNPASKDGEDILDPTTHLTCYEVKPIEGEPKPRIPRQDVLASDRFSAAQRFTLTRPKTVCVPSLKEHVDD